jgi:hypothetical protein
MLGLIENLGAADQKTVQLSPQFLIDATQERSSIAWSGLNVLLRVERINWGGAALPGILVF